MCPKRLVNTRPQEAQAGVWRPAPERAALDPSEVHVWRADLEAHGDIAQSRRTILDSEERELAARLVFERDRRSFIASHVILRDILSRYLGIEAGDIRFGAEGHGKPVLCADGGRPNLEFNMSHSHELALYALTLSHSIGVDVEHTVRDLDKEGIAARFFAPGEAADISAVRGPEQVTVFFNCWTRKEAYLKACGIGISLPLDSFRVSVDTLGHGVPVEAQMPLDDTAPWAIINIAAGNEYAAALAVAMPDPKLNCYDWAPTGK